MKQTILSIAALLMLSTAVMAQNGQDQRPGQQRLDRTEMIQKRTDDVVKKGAHAGNLIKAIAKEVGGGGGGRPTMAQAGGKNPAGIDNALKAAPGVLEGMIK